MSSTSRSPIVRTRTAWSPSSRARPMHSRPIPLPRGCRALSLGARRGQPQHRIRDDQADQIGLPPAAGLREYLLQMSLRGIERDAGTVGVVGQPPAVDERLQELRLGAGEPVALRDGLLFETQAG